MIVGGYCLVIQKGTHLFHRFDRKHLSVPSSAALTVPVDVLCIHLQLVRVTMCSYVNIVVGQGSEEVHADTEKLLYTCFSRLPCRQEMKRSSRRLSYCRGFNLSASSLCATVQLDNICCFKLTGYCTVALHTHMLVSVCPTHSVGP